jgi:hypothetical protein
MVQYGCNTGRTQVQRRDNAFNRLSLLVPRLTCPTILDRSRTVTDAYIRGSALLSYLYSFSLVYRGKAKSTHARHGRDYVPATLMCAWGG